MVTVATTIKWSQSMLDKIDFIKVLHVFNNIHSNRVSDVILSTTTSPMCIHIVPIHTTQTTDSAPQRLRASAAGTTGLLRSW